MNNGHGEHSWRQQPVSHFTVNCGGKDQPKCDCWPKNKDNICWAYQRKDAKGPTLENKPAPRHVRILSLKKDGSVVKVSFQGEEKGGDKGGVLKVANYNAFVQDAEGCRAVTPVKYRVYVRCLGCSTEDDEFHTKDGAQFTSVMKVPKMGETTYKAYTYEAWFKSPLKGKLPREIFGGVNTGLTLANVGAVPCLHEAGSRRKIGGYQIHAGSTDVWGALCFDPNTWYHVAITQNGKGAVNVYANGRDITAKGHKLDSKNSISTLAPTVGGGFGDGGQLMNVRIWDHARLPNEIYQDAFATKTESMSHVKGLDHWWPLTKDLKDVVTGVPLSGEEVRYKPIWCTDLEASGMRGC
jgi:hypothetical protein